MFALAGMVVQACIFLFIVYVVFVIASVLFNWTRMIIYHVSGKRIDMITNQEKINFGMVVENHTEAVVVDPENKTHEEFWEDFNNEYDIQLKQNQFDAEEIFFQGRIKKRR